MHFEIKVIGAEYWFVISFLLNTYKLVYAPTVHCAKTFEIN